jgi:hypothetical protein
VKLDGWCRVCHRVRRVNVHGAPIAPMPTGVCDECEKEQGRVKP